MFALGHQSRYDSLSPEEKLLTLVFACLGRDRGEQIVLDRSLVDSSVRLYYRVGGQLHEMVPPPVQIWPAIVRFLRRNSRFTPRRLSNLIRRGSFPDLPASGILPVRFGDVTCKFDILFFRGRTGQHIWIEKLDGMDVSKVSAEFLRQRLRDKPEDVVVDL